jgi:hypothetical protein
VHLVAQCGVFLFQFFNHGSYISIQQLTVNGLAFGPWHLALGSYLRGEDVHSESLKSEHSAFAA